MLAADCLADFRLSSPATGINVLGSTVLGRRHAALGFLKLPCSHAARQLTKSLPCLGWCILHLFCLLQTLSRRGETAQGMRTQQPLARVAAAGVGPAAPPCAASTAGMRRIPTCRMLRRDVCAASTTTLGGSLGCSFSFALSCLFLFMGSISHWHLDAFLVAAPMCADAHRGSQVPLGDAFSSKGCSSELMLVMLAQCGHDVR